MSAEVICAGYETGRLSVRPVAADLAERCGSELAGILCDEVLAPLPPALWQDADDPGAWIAARLGESEVLGIWQGERLVGLLLRVAPEPGTVHLGYLFARRVWGQGLASEMISGLVEALEGPLTLTGGVAADNPASARVLEKAGFRESGLDRGMRVFQRDIG